MTRVRKKCVMITAIIKSENKECIDYLWSIQTVSLPFVCDNVPDYHQNEKVNISLQKKWHQNLLRTRKIEERTKFVTRRKKKMYVLCILLTVGALVVSTNGGLRTPVSHQDSIKGSSNTSLSKLTVGLIVPYTSFSVREYTKAINRAIGNLHKGHARTKGQSRYSFLDKYNFNPQQVRHTMMKLTPSPTGKYFRDWLNLEEIAFILSEGN